MKLEIEGTPQEVAEYLRELYKPYSCPPDLDRVDAQGKRTVKWKLSDLVCKKDGYTFTDTQNPIVVNHHLVGKEHPMTDEPKQAGWPASCTACDQWSGYCKAKNSQGLVPCTFIRRDQHDALTQLVEEDRESAPGAVTPKGAQEK